jgi:quinoprotein glucose dehydrogenase
MVHSSIYRKNSSIPVKIFSVILLLFALTLFIGGIYLAYLGGSWYYVISGVILIASSVYLLKNDQLGVKLFGCSSSIL